MVKFNERPHAAIELETKLQEAQRHLTYAVENLVEAKRLAKAGSSVVASSKGTKAGQIEKAEEQAEFARALIFEIRN